MKLLAKDLRVGNVLKGASGPWANSIEWNNGINMISVYGILLIDNGTLTNLKGIRIDKDVLLASGFTYRKLGDNLGNWEIGNLEIRIHTPYTGSMTSGVKPKDEIILYCSRKHVSHKKIKYLHELQNLYYFLYGTELIIDISKLK